MKYNDKELSVADPSKASLDLNGMECRWNKILRQKTQMKSLPY
ncbi:hypothetical protein [Tenacibaculum sp.]